MVSYSNSQTFKLKIDWWFPFFIYSPSMVLFIAASFYYWNEPILILPIVSIFSFATFNFIYGYIRMFLSKVIVSGMNIIFDYYFFRWKVRLPSLIAIQKVQRFSPIGSMSIHQIALISKERIIFINDVTHFESFKQRVLIDYDRQKKL